MEYKRLLQDIWQKVYDNNLDTAPTIKQFFHPSFKQCINGEESDLDDFIKHVIAQKIQMIDIHMDYKYLVEEGESVAACYYPIGKNTKGKPIKAEVIAYVEFKNQQIRLIHGQVRYIKGSLADADMYNGDSDA